MPRPRKPASPFRYFNSSPEVIRPRVGLAFDVHVGTRGFHAQTPGGAAGAATGGVLP